MKFGTDALARLMKALSVMLTASMASSALAQVYAYDFMLYGGANKPWTVEAGPMLALEISEDPTTPGNDLLLRVRNSIQTNLSYESSISEIQIDTGSVAPGMFQSIAIDPGLSDGFISYSIYAPGKNPKLGTSLIDLNASRIAWTGDYAAGKTVWEKPWGINPGESLVLRATLADGVRFVDVIEALDIGVSSAYVPGYYSQWTTAQKTYYRAEATKGLRLTLLVHSIVPNSWDQDGHGMFVTHRRAASPGSAIQVNSLTATPSALLDTQTGQLSVTATDPEPGPQALSYQWTVVSGGGTLSQATSANAIYTPPNVTGTQAVTLRVAVSDGASTVTRDLTVQVSDADAPPPNVPPQITAVSATPSAIWEMQNSQLSVVATDTDGPGALTYEWEVVSGGGMLDSATSPNPWYSAADVNGTQTVTLRVTVSDGAASTSRELRLTVYDSSNPPPPPGAQILSQDFSVNSFAGWSYVDEGTISAPSKWRIVSGELVQQSNIRDGGTTSDLPKLGTYLLYGDGLGWTDYKTRFQLRSTDDDTLGLMFRYIDADNWYRFGWDKQRNQRQLIKKAGGVYSLLAADNVPYVMGQDYQVEIVAQGSQLEAWVDGARIFQVSDAAHKRGSIAFYTWQNNAAFFDNLVVEDLSGGNFNTVPKITAVTATPAVILDNQTSQLGVAATDTDGPNALSYQWTIVSGGGVISGATSANPIYVPVDVVGTQTVKIKVEVSDGSATVSGNLTLKVDDANPPPLGPLLLGSDFSGTLAGWSVRDEGTISAPSKWGIVAGELAQQSNIQGSINTTSDLSKLGTYLLYDGGANWANYRVKFKLRSVDDDTLGAMFRVRDNENYYRFTWDKQRNYRRLVKKEGGVFSLLAADNVPYVQGQNHVVEIVAQGSQLELWIDGERVFQVADTAHASGSVAFHTWMNNGAFFDDLQINAIE